MTAHLTNDLAALRCAAPAGSSALRGHPAADLPAGDGARRALRFVLERALTAATAASKRRTGDRLVITGAEFGAMTDEEALAGIDDIGVIARVTPEHKVRLVNVLRKQGRSWR